MTTVISHLSALRAIRRARRAYSALPWDSIDVGQQSQALAGCIPNNDAIDFDALSMLDAGMKTIPNCSIFSFQTKTTDAPTNDFFSIFSLPRFPKGRLCTSRLTSMPHPLP